MPSASTAAASRSSPVTSTVTTGAGTFQGKDRNADGVIEFLGIPYAAPPVAGLRWKPPQPAARFSGTRLATAFGASCYGLGPAFMESALQSEDSLFVNVWTGAQHTSDRKPVMVWIYGGGFQSGSSDAPTYEGTRLASQGVVYVSFNYRLGALGFLALPQLDAEEGGSSGNFGLQDQVAALQWVQQNIASFGGDPGNVTVFGESAGAHSIGILLASPLADGLFHKAILSSGAYWESEHGTMRGFEEVRRHGQKFMDSLGVKDIAEMRSLPAARIQEAGRWDFRTDPGLTAFAPSVDGYVIPVAPSVAFDTGRTFKVPILAGFNTGEGEFFHPRALPHDTAEQYQQALRGFFGESADVALGVYPGGTKPEALASADSLVGDLIISQQTWEVLDRQAETSGRDCYGYYFTYTSPYSPNALHTADIPFVFGNLEPSRALNKLGTAMAGPSTEDTAQSTRIMSYWVNFAATGSPNGEGLPAWPRYTPHESRFLELGTETAPIPTPFVDRFRFIRGLRRDGLLPVRWSREN